MDFAWSDDQEELFRSIERFAAAQLGEGFEERERAHRFDRAVWDRAASHGLAGLSIPLEHGGMGLDALTTSGAMEAFGRGCRDMGLVFSVAAHLFATCMPIAEHAPEALRARLLPGLARGELIGANAITEAEAGSDVFALKTLAVEDGEVVRLTGVKSYVTNGPVADVFLVYATRDPKRGFLGIDAYVVERGTPGLTVGEPMQTMGLTTAPICALYLDACPVPREHLLGRVGGGAKVFTGSMHWERCCLFAGYLGQMDRQLAEVIAHARARRQGRQAIARYQAISHKVVDMKLRLEAARMLLYRAAWERDRGRAATLEVALSKLAVSEAAIQSSLDAIQVFGGLGFMRDAGVERALRDSVPATLFSGTSEVQRNIAAGELGL